MIMVTFFQASKKQYLLSAFVIVATALTCFVVLPQLGAFTASLNLLRTSNVALVMVAALMSLLASVCSGLLYALLAVRPIRVITMTGVQVSGLFINRILPAGIGGIGLNVWYLRRAKHSSVQAALVVALNNTLGFLGHVLLLVVFLLFYSTKLPTIHTGRVSELGIVVVVIALLAFSTLLYEIGRAHV